MSERTKVKDVEKSPLALFCNAKEEILLNKKLRILESMKKQAENSHTLDQRILYIRFTRKLWRSEVAHAKLLGNQELVKHLSWSLFPPLHTVVTDDSDKAVRAILQNSEASRVISAPCRIQTHLAPVSASKNQGKKGEIKDQQKSTGATGKNDAQRDDQKEQTSDERQTGFSHPVSISRCKRPYTTNHQKHGRLSNMNEMSQGIFMKIPSQQQHPEAQATQATMSSSAERSVNKALKKSCLEPKCMSSKSRSYKWALNSKNLFLGLDNTPLGLCPDVNNHRNGNSHNLLEDKVKLFLQRVTTLKRKQNYPLQDYYSERLLEKLARKGKVNQEFLWNTELEQSKWNLVGPEAHHRSITINKLDRNFMKNNSSLEILIWQHYNQILTKENLMERNWLNNDPYQLITN